MTRMFDSRKQTPMLIRAVLVALLLAGGCDEGGADFTPRLSVHGLVAAGGCRPTVSVNRTYAIGEPFQSQFAGAAVRLWTRGETTACTWVGGDRYLAADSVCAGFGDTIWLQVAHPEYDTVEGRTVVPGDFQIVWPRDGDTVSLRDSMVWTRSRNAAGYYMSFRFDTLELNLIAPNDTTGGNLDSLYYRLPRLFFLFGYQAGLHSFTLCALDTNYFEWAIAGGFGGGAGSGLDSFSLVGGVGVFGSMVARSFTVFYRPESLAGAASGLNTSRRAVPQSWPAGCRGQRVWQ